MDELERGVTGASQSGIVTDRVIMLEVMHPEVPVLDLVDLPGMVHVEDPKLPGKIEAVQQIYDEQIEKNRREGHNAIYLVLVPMPSQTNAPDHNPMLTYIKDRGITDSTSLLVTSRQALHDVPDSAVRIFARVGVGLKWRASAGISRHL